MVTTERFPIFYNIYIYIYNMQYDIFLFFIMINEQSVVEKRPLRVDLHQTVHNI